jgi:hypothetical protein
VLLYLGAGNSIANVLFVVFGNVRVRGVLGFGMSPLGPGNVDATIYKSGLPRAFGASGLESVLQIVILEATILEH